MSESRPETRSSCNISTSHVTHETVSENHRILLYMDNVFNQILKIPNTNTIIVSKNTRFLKTNMSLEKAKFSYASISSFTDKIKVVIKKVLQDESIECIRLKGTKSGEIFVAFDEHLEILVFDRNRGR